MEQRVITSHPLPSDDLSSAVKDVPSHLSKKVRLLKRFKEDINKASGANLPWYFRENHTDAKTIFVEKFMMVKNTAVMFWMSNGQIQINFSTFCSIVTNIDKQVTSK